MQTFLIYSLHIRLVVHPFVEVHFLGFGELSVKVPGLWAPLSGGVGLEIDFRLHLNFSRHSNLRRKQI
jgi:hypothetical protein